MSETAEGFYGKKLEAIELLARGEMMDKDVASSCGIARETLYEWKKLPGFKDAVIARSREILFEKLPELYAIGMARSRENASYFRTMMEHLEKIESKIDESREIIIRWK